MNFGDLQHALRNLLQRGMRNPMGQRMQGLRDLLQQLRQQRRQTLDQLQPLVRLRRHQEAARRDPEHGARHHRPPPRRGQRRADRRAASAAGPDRRGSFAGQQRQSQSGQSAGSSSRPAGGQQQRAARRLGRDAQSSPDAQEHRRTQEALPREPARGRRRPHEGAPELRVHGPGGAAQVPRADGDAEEGHDGDLLQGHVRPDRRTCRPKTWRA